MARASNLGAHMHDLFHVQPACDDAQDGSTNDGKPADTAGHAAAAAATIMHYSLLQKDPLQRKAHRRRPLQCQLAVPCTLVQTALYKQSKQCIYSVAQAQNEAKHLRS
eukprot:GHRQ01023470.1.p1 GENE.GHRQ01023470.1~~GHRQ01023470.1.p1  ORF type:complete len:108 (+),score=14.08 GHRQ01023470.1:150-473(+)